MFDTEAIYKAEWEKLATEMGVDLPSEFRVEICGTCGELAYSIVEKYYGVEDGSKVLKECFRRTHERLAVEVPEKPGIHEILQFFQDNGVKLAVASSSALDNIRHNLRMTNTEHYFDALVSGVDLEHGKPAPDIFQKAAKELGLAPEDCYVFEDSTNGVLAGLAAGCTTVMIPDTVPPTEEVKQRGAIVHRDLLEALEAIKMNK